MALQPANHYVITGKGVDAVIDTAGITGTPAVSLTVGGPDAHRSRPHHHVGIQPGCAHYQRIPLIHFARRKP